MRQFRCRRRDRSTVDRKTSHEPRIPAQRGKAMNTARSPEHFRRGAPSSARPASAGAAVRRAARALASAALFERHEGTADHSDDVADLSAALADELGIIGEEREELLAAAELHDVGKLAISSSILEKAGPLDDAEWEQMRQHT